MAQYTQGYTIAGQGTNVGGIGDFAWGTPENITANDNVRATANTLATGTVSNYLRASSFGFTVPSGATIRGIEVQIDRGHSGGTSTSDNAARIVMGGVIGSVDRSISGNWAAAETLVTYGSSTDLWGLGWTADDINSAGFGFALSVNSVLTISRVDYVQIKVHYDLPLNAQYSSSNPYSDGKLMYKEGAGSWTDIATSDLYFKTLASPGATTIAYNNTDPSTILMDILDKYAADGGTVEYDASSIDATGIVIDYTFNLATTLEGIDTVYKLAPAGWYWYVDPGTNILHFHQIASSAEHIMILGQHISNFSPEYTIEGIKNIAYFSGGEATPGVNVFKISSATSSIANYGRRLTRSSDNRVTTDSTAELIAQNEATKNNVPIFRGTMEVPADVYNIDSFILGQTIGLSNFGEFMDSFVLQIVGIKPHPDVATLSIGVLPIRNTRRIEQLKRELEKLQTVNNPTTPS